MKAVLIVVIVAVAFANASKMCHKNHSEWSTFKKSHKKQYHNDAHEAEHFQNFLNNIEKINSHNADASNTHSLGITSNADLSFEQMRQNRMGYKAASITEVHHQRSRRDIAVIKKYKSYFSPNIFGVFAATKTLSSLPKSLDLTTKYPLPVRDQGQCGCCWAFATSEAIEFFLFKTANKTVRLSPQELIDCTRNYQNNGCNGGVPLYTFDYILTKQALDAETDNVYLGKDTQKCGATKLGSVKVPLGNYIIINGDDLSLMQALNDFGAVVVALNADALQHYTNGTMKASQCSNDVNHIVLLVGYGTDSNGDYWIFRNSWGTNWGMKGHFRLQRNANTCGMYTQPIVPVQDKNVVQTPTSG